MLPEGLCGTSLGAAQRCRRKVLPRRQSPPMHLVIPFAAALSEPGRDAMRGLRLPGLRALLAGREGERDDGDETSLSPPHERAMARTCGWSGGDGLLPFAAAHAAADGIDPGDLAWGELTPVHWHLGTEQVSLADPATLGLGDEEARALFDAVRELFTSEGFAISYGAPLRWYVAHESLAELATASIDRVIGRNVDPWLGSGTSARLIRRLQNEVQMLLHTHRLNAEREARGEDTVNSFWLSGCGRHQPATGAASVDDALRAPALAEDWAAWSSAWSALDAGLADRGLSRLTLCGERAGVTFELAHRGWFRRLSASWSASEPMALLESL